jgi:hypothetical protein
MKMDEKGIGTALIVVIVVAVIVVAVAVPAVILLKPGEGPAPGGPTTTPTTTPPITTTPLTTTTPTTTTTPWTAAQGLQIALKDQGMPEVKFLQPTIIEIQLQLENGDWKTIWSDPNGIKLTLTPGGPEQILGTVSLDAGTYVGTRLLVSTIYVEVDINRDGDTLDENVEIILPENFPPPSEMIPVSVFENIKATADQIKPKTDQIENLTARMEELRTQIEDPATENEERQSLIAEADETRTQIEGLVGEVEGLMDQIKQLTGGTGLPRREGGYIYTGSYLDEKHTAIPPNNIVPVVWEENFVYGGSGGKILYDLTLHPLKPKHEQISVKVSTEA